MTKLTAKLSAASLAILLATGCASTEEAASDPNAAMKRGAAGGALVGLTLGALTGEADLAVKGAVAGGVSGGVAGAMEDLNSGREDRRTDTMAGAIAGTTAEQSDTSWALTEQLAGDWSVQAWSYDGESTVTGLSKATGINQGNSSAVLSWQLNEANVSGQVSLSYSQDQGYQLISTSTSLDAPLVFAGEKVSEQLYRFYPVNSTSSDPQHLELKALNPNFVQMDGYVTKNGEQKLVQSFRLNRS